MQIRIRFGSNVNNDFFSQKPSHRMKTKDNRIKRENNTEAVFGCLRNA